MTYLARPVQMSQKTVATPEAQSIAGYLLEELLDDRTELSFPEHRAVLDLYRSDLRMSDG
jgi:hypothetical protein